MITNFRFTAFLSSLAFMSIGIVFNSLNLILVAILLIFFNNVFYSVEKINKRVIFLFFNVCFFTFLIGGYLNNLIEPKLWTEKFTMEIIEKSLILIYISLFALFIGFSLNIKNEKIKLKYTDENSISSNINIEYIKSVSKYLFFLTYFFIIIKTLEMAIYVQSNGYLSLYLYFSSKLPSFFVRFSQMNIVFIYIFLSTFPQKKELKGPLIAYILYLIMTLLTGERGTFVTSSLVIILYLLIREKYNNPNNEKFLNKELLIVSAPFIIVFLSAYNILRNGSNINDFNLIKEFFKFFKDQGGSSDIINYVQSYRNKLYNTNVNYTLGPIINYFKYGFVARIINGNSLLKGNTIGSALYGNNLGATITYLVNPQMYFSGGGLGTQYIAELYADFGYLGVIIYNFLIGILLNKLNTVYIKNWVLFTFGLLICNDLFFMPRASALEWFGNFYSFYNWLSIFMTYIISYFFYHRNNNKKIN